MNERVDLQEMLKYMDEKLIQLDILLRLAITPFSVGLIFMKNKSIYVSKNIENTYRNNL